MVYYANGGFNWNDLYYMPTKLREFYWRELLHAKDEETKALEKSKASNSAARTRRR
jgi:hypothetical protein